MSKSVRVQRATIASLIADLHSIQAENLVPSRLTGEAADAESAALAKREDRAYAAVSRAQATNLVELHQKLLVTLEGFDLIKREATGMFGGAGAREANLLLKSLLADAERLCHPACAQLKHAA